MNWADLQLLLAFADAGTLKAAAETQGVNISTVSRRLRTLEGEIGAKVVENVGGRLTLTESGERAVAAARAMRHASDDLLRDVAGKDDELAGPVRIGLLEMFVRYHASAFVELSRSYPNLEL
ncbi:MAG: LysR family transcriptional regulator, partial [Myxococcota bacterium]